MTHPQAMEFFAVKKYFLFILQHNIIEFQKHKRSGHPKEITFTAVKNDKYVLKGGRVSVSTLTYFQNRNESQK